MDKNTENEAEWEEVKMSFKNKMMLLAIFGVLLGFMIKTEAAKRITVGFEDYKLEGAENTFNISQLQKELEQRQALPVSQENAPDSSANVSQ